MNAARFGALVLADLKMLARNRTALFFSLLFPLIFMVIFGLIFRNADQQKIDLNVVGSGPLVTALAQSGVVTVRPRADAADALKRVKDGKEEGALIVSGRTATLYYSGAQIVQAATLRGIVKGVADEVNLRASAQPLLVEVEARQVESSRLRYIDFLVPGLLAMALSQSAVFGTSGALVSFRERGIFRRLRVTPLPLREFAAAHVVQHLALALLQTVVLLGIGKSAFDVHLGLSLVALVPLVLVGALCFVTIGLFVGSVARSQEAAAAMANVITLPMIFLAGVFFPLDTAPNWLQEVARVLPLTYLARGLRDVAVRGHSFGSTWVDLVVLGGVTLAVGALSLRLFRWDTT